MSIIPANIPEELTALSQWLIWRYQVREGKATKVPHTTMGYRASVTNPDHWSTFDHALKAAGRTGFADGIGFVFTVNDPYCGMDLDTVWQSDADEGASWAEGILERFSDTYGEASPSNTGYKLWCKARVPRCGRWPVEAGAIELYDRGRFFTVTTRSNRVLTVADHQEDIELLVARLDQDRAAATSRPIDSTIPQGQRHPALVSLAGTMRKRGMDLDAIEAALLVVNAKQCDPPYPVEHVHQIVASMSRWER